MIQGNIKGRRSSDSDRRSGQTASIDQLLDRGLHRPVQSFLSRRGKALRASLMGHCYRIAGGADDVPSQAVTAIELLHAGSLIVDDIEDRSQVRRGQPTLHRQIGLPLALNTGNWMYFRALEILGDLTFEHAEMDQLLLRTISTVRECHEGQAIDLTARIFELDQSEVRPTVEAISRRKTAALTALAARISATLAGAAESDQEVMAMFGAGLGMCLQMRNDLDEVHQARADGGRCDDLLNGRVTWPWAWFAEQCGSKQFEELQSRALDAQMEPEAARNIAAILYHSVERTAEQQIAQGFQQEFLRLHTVFDNPSAVSDLHQALRVIAAGH